MNEGEELGLLRICGESGAGLVRSFESGEEEQDAVGSALV